MRHASAFPLILLASAALAQAAPVEDRVAFGERCRAELLARHADAGTWADGQCEILWNRAAAAGPMAEALLQLAPAPGEAPGDPRARLPGVDWHSATEGSLGDLAVLLLPGPGHVAFHWQDMGSEGRYNLPDALRIRGVALRSLGCPQYPGAAMGMEKVMLAEAEGRAPFVLAVYSRPSPTGFEPAVYEVDAGFGTAPPDLAALAAGAYPGGGGRAFAVDPLGWVADCPDPE